MLDYYPQGQSFDDLPLAEGARSARWREFLSKDEIADLLRPSDWRSWWSVGFDWAVVLLAMAMVYHYPNPLTIVLALFLIGARQLGLGVLMHEASHRSLFADRAVNDWVGNWLAGYPIWSNLAAYREYHLQHHSKTWTAADPDLNLVAPFPITRASLRRKLGRDLSGRTGWKFARFAARRDFGDGPWRERLRRAATIPALRGMLVSNAVLLALVSLLFHPAVYLLWVAAWLTTYTLVTRIRSIAEHAMAPDPGDPLRNTRTTRARWWERLLIAPNRVNFHLEHHLLMTVPHYHLPRMHRMLVERGALDGAFLGEGYPAILAQAASKPA